MIFLAPALLLGLVALPALWWLIRATPPAPRTQRFPSLIILERLTPNHQDAARSPLWLFLLRLCAVALIIFGLARPILPGHPPLENAQDLTIILDDGWTSTPHWAARITAAEAAGNAALLHHHHVTLLRSAPTADGFLPHPFHPDSPQEWSDMLHHLQPQPWPIDRAALIKRLPTRPQPTESLLLISDGIATPQDHALLDNIAPYTTQADLRWPLCDVALLSIQSATDHTQQASILQAKACAQRMFTLHALTEQGGTLAKFTLPSQTSTALALAPALRHQLDHFTLDGDYGLAGQYHLGDAGHRRPVGVLPTPGDATPLTGSAFFLNQALDTIAERHSVPSTALPTTPLSVLIATDGALSGDSTREHVLAWVKQGGTLIRFAGPGLAAQASTPTPNTEPNTAQPTDPLIAVPLMNGLRQLGGPMSWGKPQALAAFAPNSPFYGLPIPTDVTITKQVLAQPTPDLSSHVWAALTDGTPLVTAQNYGNGEIILFHVTASPDWSNLPLSGLFPSMLERLIARSAGIAQSDTGALSLWRAFDAHGTLIEAPPAAQPLTMATMSRTSVTVQHPAGLYGPIHGTHALNLGDNAPPLSAAPLFGTPITPHGLQVHTPLAPFAFIAGLGVLIIDMLLSLYRRGLLRRRTALLVLVLTLSTIAPPRAQADDDTTKSNAPAGALETHLAYIETGNPDIDNISRMGLQGLSDYTSTRSSALLGGPIGVQPGRDDLAFYPLLYWPITTDIQADPDRTKALNNFMEHGGILLIDELGAGTDIDPGHKNAIRDALKRATDGLMVPPLAKLNDQHVLSHTFYLMHGSYPGRIAGQPVYVAQTGDEANDGVSPVIIGNAGWAYAWAIDNTGNHPYATIPGGDEQRTIAYRFGLNMIVYALTGNYKSDQAHYPEMLHRLGQSATSNSNPSDDTDGDDAP
nr:DUF4159 domain-containing protein [uncultured Neokomagataea sp.]